MVEVQNVLGIFSFRLPGQVVYIGQVLQMGHKFKVKFYKTKSRVGFMNKI